MKNALDEAVAQATKLITHDHCMDGLATAMIAQDANPHLEIVFVQYNTPEHAALAAEPGMIFCDMSPPRERVQEFVDVGAAVLDHHKHAEDVVRAFGFLGVFADEKAEPGVSGAVLAHRHIWMPRKQGAATSFSVREFARLVGVRDTWQSHDTASWVPALALHAVLEAFPRAYWLGTPDFEGQGPVRGAGIEEALDSLMVGRLFLEEKAQKVERAAAERIIAHDAPGGGKWALSAEPSALVSDLGDRVRGAGFNVLVNLHHVIQGGQLKYAVSMRSDGSVDVGALAKKHGGGGHTRAAGCLVSQQFSPLGIFFQLMNEAVPDLTVS